MDVLRVDERHDPLACSLPDRLGRRNAEFRQLAMDARLDEPMWLHVIECSLIAFDGGSHGRAPHRNT